MSLTTNPMPLGQLKPGASFATVTVQAISNVTASLNPTKRVAGILLQAGSANTATIFITSDGKVAASDYSNVLFELAKGERVLLTSATGTAQIDPRNFYVAAQNNADFGFGCIWEV